MKKILEDLKLKISQIESISDSLGGEYSYERLYSDLKFAVDEAVILGTMDEFRHNQSKCSYLLNINRGTFRKKLRLLGYMPEKVSPPFEVSHEQGKYIEAPKSSF